MRNSYHNFAAKGFPDANNIFGTFIHELGEVTDLRDPETLKLVRNAALTWYAEEQGYDSLDDAIEKYRRA